MPEYCITTKEIWYGYLYINADDIDDAIRLAKDGEGEVTDTDFGDTIGYVCIRDVETDEETDLETPATIVDDSDPNNIFVKSKKQEEVDKAINILKTKHLTYRDIDETLERLRSIKNI